VRLFYARNVRNIVLMQPISSMIEFKQIIGRGTRLFGELPSLFKASHYDPKVQAFLDFVLSQYVKEGVGELDQAKLPHLLELRYRAVSDAALELGGVAKIRDAFVGFQAHLYAQ
jgi:type I restriction enzyme R subunit